MPSQRTFAERIECMADGEEIIAISIDGHRYDDQFNEIDHLEYHEPISWEEARPLLNYVPDSGYGTLDMHAIYAWTETRVLFVCQYDGSSWVSYVPRHPTKEQPYTKGDG